MIVICRYKRHITRHSLQTSASWLFKKYNAEFIETEHKKTFDKTFYHDLDGNGISKKLYAGYNYIDKFARVIYFDINDKIIDKWNLRGKWINNYKLYFGDYNRNGGIQT